MKQVNITLTDEEYELLVVEAAKQQAEKRAVIRISTLAGELLKPVIANLNGNSPAKTPTQDTEQVEKQDDEQETNPFASLDI